MLWNKQTLVLGSTIFIAFVWLRRPSLVVAVALAILVMSTIFSVPDSNIFSIPVWNFTLGLKSSNNTGICNFPLRGRPRLPFIVGRSSTLGRWMMAAMYGVRITHLADLSHKPSPSPSPAPAIPFPFVGGLLSLGSPFDFSGGLSWLTPQAPSPISIFFNCSWHRFSSSSNARRFSSNSWRVLSISRMSLLLCMIGGEDR